MTAGGGGRRGTSGSWSLLVFGYGRLPIDKETGMGADAERGRTDKKMMKNNQNHVRLLNYIEFKQRPPTGRPLTMEEDKYIEFMPIAC